MKKQIFQKRKNYDEISSKSHDLHNSKISQNTELTLKTTKTNRKIQRGSRCVIPDSKTSRITTEPPMRQQFNFTSFYNFASANDNVETILQKQNKNLKKHCNFLLTQAKKYKNALKSYIKINEKYVQRIFSLQCQNQLHRKQFLELKEQVLETLSKIEQSVCDNCLKNILSKNMTGSLTLSNSEESNLFEQTAGIVSFSGEQNNFEKMLPAQQSSIMMNEMKFQSFSLKNTQVFLKNKQNKLQKKMIEIPTLKTDGSINLLQDDVENLLSTSRDFLRNKKIIQNMKNENNPEKNTKTSFNISFGLKNNNH